MQINLLSNNKGVITTRQAEIVGGEWKVTFDNAPDNASAIFKNSKNNELYRLLADGSCIVPLSFLKCGEISITITTPKTDKKKDKEQIWHCEGVTVQQIGDSKNLLISPCDMDIPSRIAQIETTLDGFVRSVASLEKHNAQLQAELEKLIEGYDID